MAAWASAQARNVLPTPVGPVTSTLRWAVTQWPSARPSPVEPPGAAQVEILDDRVAAETGGFEVACKPAVLAVLHLPVDEQAEALLEAEGGVVGTLQLVDQRAGHAGQGKGVQLVDRRCDEHAVDLLLTRSCLLYTSPSPRD